MSSRSLLIELLRMLSPNRLAVFCVFLCCIQPINAQDLNLPSPEESVEGGDGVVEALPSTENEMFAEDAFPMGEEVEEYSPQLFPDSTWMNPTRWLAGPTWEKGIELGINGSEGNAQAFSILASGNLKRDTERSTWGIDVVYGKTEANDVLTQHYAFLNSRYDFKFVDSRWSLFNITRIEYDEFKVFDWRLAINGGVGYDVLKSDTTKFTGRFGAGTSREFGGSNDEWVPEAVFGADYEHKLSNRQKLAITSDYYPSWKDFEDYRLVTQGSWELLLDEDTNLSLKVGLLNRYDSTPMGLKPSDVDYFITLLWKL